MRTNTFKLLFVLSFCITYAYGQVPKSYASSEVLLELKKLQTQGSVLYIAAHPDDENTRLISYLANEKCLRTGYLSLTRGDGGQNLIGSEQGIELGVIRTQELLAARRTDGGEQFFTRAYDFGYSKTPKETFEKWNHEEILKDVVYVIRKFRPDIIITRFATDGSGGHGHHTASAILAEEAFEAAADPQRFPEQLSSVSVWKTKRMFYNSAIRFWNPNADMSGHIKLDVGGFNPMIGKNYGEIAAESRSMHKSQGFGSARQRGEIFEYFKPIKGDTANLNSIFDRLAFDGSDNMGSNLNKYLSAATKAYQNQDLKACNAQLLKALSLLPETNPELAYKRKQLIENICRVNALFIEAVAENSPTPAIGDSVKIKFIGLNRSNTTISLENLSLEEFGGSTACDGGQAGLKAPLLNNIPFTYTFSRTVCKDNRASEMYWLSKEIKDNKFDIDPSEVGIPFATQSGFYVVAELLIQGVPVKTKVKVQYKWTDPEKGENYRPLIISNPAYIQVLSPVLVCADTFAREVKIKVKAGKDKVQGNIRILMPTGWKLVNSGANANSNILPFALDKKGEERELSFWVKAPIEEDQKVLQLEMDIEGKTYNQGLKEIAYNHIPTQTLFPHASIKLVKLQAIHHLKKIAYIPGAGDEVVPCLSQLGYEVIELNKDLLASENLDAYEAIITGVRAYNVQESLTLNKKKLMDYVSKGGNLIVQYNTNSFAGPFKGDIGPYPFKITRDRITDENAKVVFDLPEHPVLNKPNKISAADFNSWIQERSIYHGGEWDKQYEAPISMSDPNEKSNSGALLIANHGKGHFVYTGLVFFRELPAGVPGAYRLFINLIELGK